MNDAEDRLGLMMKKSKIKEVSLLCKNINRKFYLLTIHEHLGIGSEVGKKCMWKDQRSAIYDSTGSYVLEKNYIATPFIEF